MSAEAPRTLTLRPVHEQWPAAGWPPDENDLSVIYRGVSVARITRIGNGQAAGEWSWSITWTEIALRFMPSHGRASSRDDAVQEIGSRFSTVPDEILARVKVGRVIPARTDDGNASPA